jgi:hypothetical protein
VELVELAPLRAIAVLIQYFQPSHQLVVVLVVNPTNGQNGKNGGSGGASGAAQWSGGALTTAGTGTANQGYAGGLGAGNGAVTEVAGGGGGGASAVGSNRNNYTYRLVMAALV